jgi:hypothetical protein
MGEPVKKPILGFGRFAGVEPGIFCGIFYRLGFGLAARLEKGIFLGIFFGAAGGLARGSARRGLNGLIYGARGRHSSSTSGARGCDWANSAESSGGACGLPPSPMKLILASVSLYG